MEVHEIRIRLITVVRESVNDEAVVVNFVVPEGQAPTMNGIEELIQTSCMEYLPAHHQIFLGYYEDGVQNLHLIPTVDELIHFLNNFVNITELLVLDVPTLDERRETLGDIFEETLNQPREILGAFNGVVLQLLEERFIPAPGELQLPAEDLGGAAALFGLLENLRIIG